MEERFGRIVVRTAQQWRPAEGGDPNTIDLMWIALGIEKLGTPLPRQLPTKELGVALIEECIEGRFVTGLIRYMPPAEIAARSWALVECTRAKGFVHAPLAALAALLLMWSGCIGMAKALRIETSAGERYTENVRRANYADLQRTWEAEEAAGDSWFKFGVSLARRLEQGRGNAVVDEWVPRGSPYWE